MFFHETSSVTAFNICKEEVNLNRKINLRVPLKNFSQRQGVSHSLTSFLNPCIKRKKEQRTLFSISYINKEGSLPDLHASALLQDRPYLKFTVFRRSLLFCNIPELHLAFFLALS